MLKDQRETTRRHLFLLLLLFPLLYLLNLGIVELRSSEALLGTIAREMETNVSALSVTAHGDAVDAFPMYPWLIHLCSGFQSPGTWTVRLPAALSVLAMALISGAFALHVSGPLAAAVTGAVLLTNLAFLRVGVRAQTETVLALFLSTGWLAWFFFGQEKKRWGLAWLAATLCLIAAVFTDGARAIAYFYLPFFFLRRPVRGRRRLLFPSHILCVLLMILVIGGWLMRVPSQPFMPWNVLQIMPTVSGSYVLHLLTFPLKFAIYLLPWTAILWAPFCLAYRHMEKRPVLFHYLRTIVLCAFLLSWVLPNTSPLAMLPVVPLLAILGSMHVAIVARRHRLLLEKGCLLLSRLALIFSGILTAMILLHFSGVVVLVGFDSVRMLFSAFWCVLILLTAVWFQRSDWRRHASLWKQAVLGMLSLRVLLLVSMEPLNAWRGNERMTTGRALSTILRYETTLVETPGEDKDSKSNGSTTDVGTPEPPSGPGANPPAVSDGLNTRMREVVTAVETGEALPDVIYRATQDYFLTECFYTDRAVRHVEDLENDLPADATSVFVLAGEKPPILSSRTWEPCSPLIDTNSRKTQAFSWWLGDQRLLYIVPVPRKYGPGEHPVYARMYRGVLR